ncbi:MAG TPA: YciI family protein [Candidatus Eisenbacteria bacterium]|jgi:uncharacterized protein YciI|nr:YciI family protein [Candidatus Eisenbacteria bacterium]
MMKVLSILLALTVVGVSIAHAEDRGKPVSVPARGGPPSPELMQTYYFVLLYRNDDAPKIPEDSVNAIQAGHMANIMRLHEEKKMPLAGPFLDDTALRGIFILNAVSMEEAQQLVHSDPAIQAGRLRAEIHPWYGARGIRTAFDDKYMLKPNEGAR